MSITYATMSTKGQVTIPVEIRETFELQPGSKIGFRVENDSVSLELPATIDEIRAMLQASMKAGGTDILPAYHNGDGFTAYVQEKYGQS